MKKADLLKLLSEINSDKPIYCVNNQGDYSPIYKIEPLFTSGNLIPDCYIIRGRPSDNIPNGDEDSD